MKRDLVYSTILHNNPVKIPQVIGMNKLVLDAYGDILLSEYPNKQVLEDLKAGIINRTQAVSLSIGNHILNINPPWWDWFDPDGVFRLGDEPPDFLPDTRGSGNYDEFFSKLAVIRKHYDVYLLIRITGSHWEKANSLRGIENFLTDLAMNTKWAQSLLDIIIMKNLVMLENVLSAPESDGVLLGSDWGTQLDLIMSPECFRTMIKPGEQKEYDLIKKYNKHVFIHSCGNITRILGDLVEMGVDCLNPVQPECMDLEFIRNEYGDRLTWYGGISTQKILPFGTPEEVRRETKRIIEMMYNNGGYITAPSQQIQIDVPYRNLKALIDTAREYWI